MSCQATETERRLGELNEIVHILTGSYIILFLLNHLLQMAILS